VTGTAAWRRHPPGAVVRHTLPDPQRCGPSRRHRPTVAELTLTQHRVVKRPGSRHRRAGPDDGRRAGCWDTSPAPAAAHDARLETPPPHCSHEDHEPAGDAMPATPCDARIRRAAALAGYLIESHTPPRTNTIQSADDDPGSAAVIGHRRKGGRHTIVSQRRNRRRRCHHRAKSVRPVLVTTGPPCRRDDRHHSPRLPLANKSFNRSYDGNGPVNRNRCRHTRTRADQHSQPRPPLTWLKGAKTVE